MNKTITTKIITLYELLGMIKNKIAPKKVLINDKVYYLLVDKEHYVYSQNSHDLGQWDFFIDHRINISQNLDLEVVILEENYEVEIIEEDKKIEKLESYSLIPNAGLREENDIITENFKKMFFKINELIDEVIKLKGDKE